MLDVVPSMTDTDAEPMPAAHRLVLVVDDDQDLRDALRQLLEEEGYEVICAEHGRAALAHLRGGLAPDAILLDLWMPVMDGWQLRRELELDPALSRIPIVLLTATREVDAKMLGVRAVLNKPIGAKALLGALERLN
jgi:CheY-like chemotaxis protein